MDPYIARVAQHERFKAQRALLRIVNDTRADLGLPLREREEIITAKADREMLWAEFARGAENVARSFVRMRDQIADFSRPLSLALGRAGNVYASRGTHSGGGAVDL